MNELAQQIISAAKETMLSLIASGSDAMAVLEGTRDFFAERFGMSPVEASNFTRLLIASAGQDRGIESYTRAEIRQIGAGLGCA